MKNVCSLFISLLMLELCDFKHISHPIPTFFQRKHRNGSFVDMRDVDNFRKVLDKQYSTSDDYSNSVITVTPDHNLKDQHEVTVSWMINGKTSLHDWIGLFCPPDALAVNVLDYFYSTVSNNWFKGQGSYNVTLFNLRAPCEFRYYQYEKASLVAISKPLMFRKRGEEPIHGHISMTNNPGEMRVMWISNNKVDTPLVYYGLRKEALILKAYGTSKTYNASDMCESPANGIGFRDPGIIHDVLLKVLLPNTRYYYKFGAGRLFSEVNNFTTPLPAGNPLPHKIITFGDHGVGSSSPGANSTSQNMLEEIKVNNIRMILHNGDISYAEGYGYIWDQWSTLVESYTTLVPYMVGIGNHEQDHWTGGSKDPSGAGNGFHPIWGNFKSDSGGECGVPMYYRFHMPDNGNSLWWYSYDFGLVHYIVMSTEHDFRPNSTQYNWLENDLKSVDRKLTPWLVVTGHRPMYMSQEEVGDIFVSLNLRRCLEDMFYNYGVDVCLWAHVHSYERTCTLYKNRCQDDGIVHFITGSAGKNTDENKYLDYDWSEYRAKVYGYGRITVYNSTQLKYEFVLNEDRSVIDSYTFLK